MFTDMMIDLETLSTRTDAVVLSVGAVMFRADQDEQNKPRQEFYELPNIQSQISAGLNVQADTLKWWFKQSDNARGEFSGTDKNLDSYPTVLKKLTQFYGAYKPRRVWSHGATFDLPILATAYAIYGMECPWKYWDGRDTRTLFELLGEGRDGKLQQLLKPGNTTAHNAVIDCQHQANAVNYAWRKLKGVL